MARKIVQVGNEQVQVIILFHKHIRVFHLLSILDATYKWYYDPFSFSIRQECNQHQGE
jgi:hypothetical protein